MRLVSKAINFIISYKFAVQNRYIKAEYKFFVTNFDMRRRDNVGQYREAENN